MVNKEHVDKIFNQRFSFLDQKMLEKYFEDKVEKTVKLTTPGRNKMTTLASLN